MSGVESEKLPEVKEEQILICEKCGKELGFVLYFTEVNNKCPTCKEEAKPDDCWLLCHSCRGVGN